MSKLNWLEKAFFKPKAGKSLARSVIVTVVAVALVLGVGLVPIAPLTETAQANGSGQTPKTLHVAKWSEPTPITNETNEVKGRETVLYDGLTYHMWYSPSDTVINYTYSTDPDSFPEGTKCTFGTDNEDQPFEVGSVTVREEDGTFYMIAYEKSSTTDATKKFAIYTSSNGVAWTYGRTVFDGGTNNLFKGSNGATIFTINKIDGPFLFKTDTGYRLYFQVKTGSGESERYNIYAAESPTIGGTYTLVNDSNPVLSPDTDTTKWDGKYVMHPWVVKDDDGTYYMWYSAHDGNNDNQKIGFAYSTNGYDWVKSPGNPILPDGTATAGEPSVIKDNNGTWHMWRFSGAIYYYEATGPFEFSSIQDAVDAAESGDTIKVAPGTYVQDSDITVPEGVTLELSPGTTLKFVNDAETKIGITVNGTLIAEGTESEKITFTSNQDTPAAGDWKGLSFGLTATESIIDNCIIEYAYVGVNVAWTTITAPKTAPIKVQNSTLQNISYRGVSFAGHDETHPSGRGVVYHPVTGIKVVNNEFIDVGKSGMGENPSAIYTRSVKNVEISGNLFQGGEGTRLAYLGAAFENYTFADNIIEDPGYEQGVLISTTNGHPQILRNKFTGEATASNFRCIWAWGHTGMTIKNNEFYTGSSGIYIEWYVNSPDVVEVLIEGNTFDGVGSGGDDSYAILDDSLWNNPREDSYVKSWVRNGVIKNNIIKNTNGVAISIPRGTLTSLEYGDVDYGDVLIEGNTIENNTVGIQVGLASNAKYGLEGIEAHFNNIVGNDIGVKNISVSDDSFDATLNWWGTANGDEIAEMVSGNVNFTPWLLTNDITPLTVDNTEPRDKATNVAVDKTITVTFDEVIQPGEKINDVTVKVGSSKVEFTSSISGNTLSITPEGRWAYSTTYNVTIPAGAVKNEAGAPLQDTYTFSFTTRSKPSGGAPAPELTPTPPSAIEPVSDSVVNNAIEEAEETGQVTIEVNKEETALNTEQLEQIADTDKPAAMKINEVEFVLPPEVVADLAETDAVQIEITAEKVAEDEIPIPPSGFKLAGEVFELTIVAVDKNGNKDEITGFTKAITITLPVPASAKDAAVAGKLDVYRYNETTKTWEAMGGTYDAATNTIRFSTDHLSKYALMEKTALPTKTFADIKGHWAQSDIEIMAGLGIVGGISENEFAPQMPVNRAQFAAFLIRSLDIQETSPAESHFKDVPTNAWYYGAVEGAYAAGLVGGYEDGTFKPEKEISRQEIAALIARALKNAGQEVSVGDVDSVLARFKDASMISPWAKEEAAQAVASGIIGGRDGLFAPKDSATRAEAVVMLKRMLVKLGVI